MAPGPAALAAEEPGYLEDDAVAVSALVIDKRSPFSIQRQLATQLVYLIRSGSLRPGEQLPTVRQLAGYLRINHNTVALAYRELEAQGLLRVEQGRGTFVTEAGAAAGPDRHAALVAAVRDAFERCRALGASAEEFLDAAAAVVQRAGGGEAAAIRVLLVECNPGDVGHMQRVLAPELNVRLSAATVEELASRTAAERQALSDIDLIVTTFFHVNEVEALTDAAGVKVAGLYMGPSIRTLMRLMALAPSVRIGVVGASPVCARGLAASLRNVLGTDRPLSIGHAGDAGSVREATREADLVVYPENVRSVVEPALPERLERIVVEKQIDRGSIEMLKELAADLARRKAAAAAGAA